MRQWVLRLPIEIRYRMAWDGPLLSALLRTFMQPLEFIGRLAALTPPPRPQRIRYHGVLAPHATARALIVPSASHASASDVQPSGGHVAL